MYFPLVVYFFTQRSLFAKKDYSNTKQRAGQGATKEKSRGGVKGGGRGPGVFQEPKRLDGRRYNIWFISLALSLIFFFCTDFILFAHANMETRSTQPSPFGKAATPRNFMCVSHAFLFRFFFSFLVFALFTLTIFMCLWLLFVFVLVQQPSTFTHVSRWRKRSKFEHVCVRVCFAKAKRKWQFSVWHVRSMRVCVYLVGGNFPFSFSGWKAF